MDSQITLRLPADLGRALARKAKAQRVPKSQLVREAVAKYLAEPEGMTDEQFAELNRRFIGSQSLDHEAIMADPVARHIYERNFRP